MKPDTVKHKFQIHGHRGFRTKFPENTIEGFREAVRLGVDAIEMDIVATREKELLVSHEPWISGEVCLYPDGKSIAPEEEPELNIFEMNYEDIKLFDCGSKQHPLFPQQENMLHHKPLLRDVVSIMEWYYETFSFYYNLEIKSHRDWYGDFQPEPSEYVDIILHELRRNKLMEHVMVQSFDPAILNYLHRRKKNLPLGLLVDEGEEVQKKHDKLLFAPYAVNVHDSLATPAFFDFVREKQCKAFIWTVNDVRRSLELEQMGASGVITDDPALIISAHRAVAGRCL